MWQVFPSSPIRVFNTVTFQQCGSIPDFVGEMGGCRTTRTEVFRVATTLANTFDTKHQLKYCTVCCTVRCPPAVSVC